jgi:hypothetical protein
MLLVDDDDDEGIGCFAPSVVVTASNNPSHRHNTSHDGCDDAEVEPLLTIIFLIPSCELLVFVMLLQVVILFVEELVLGVGGTVAFIVIGTKDKLQR